MSLDNTFKSLFPENTTEEWYEKIFLDLKGKSIESLSKKYNDLTLAPFASFDDNSIRPNRIVNEKKAWSISTRIQSGEPQSMNTNILNALTLGVNAPIVELNKEYSFDDLETIFRGVQPEYIYTFFAIDYNIDPSSVIYYINKKVNENPNCKFGFINTSATASNDTNTPITIRAKVDWRQNACETDYLAELIGQFYSFIKEEKEAHSYQFYIEAHPKYLLNTAIIRAIKCLYSNVLEALNIEIQKEIFIISHWSAQNENENTNLISNTALAVSSIVGGADLLDMPLAGSDPVKHDFYQRMNININHLMDLESDFGNIANPMEGSYFLEDLTNKMVEISWNKFINNLK